jgi:hypothetical protein
MRSGHEPPGSLSSLRLELASVRKKKKKKNKKKYTPLELTTHSLFFFLNSFLHSNFFYTHEETVLKPTDW